MKQKSTLSKVGNFLGGSLIAGAGATAIGLTTQLATENKSVQFLTAAAGAVAVAAICFKKKHKYWGWGAATTAVLSLANSGSELYQDNKKKLTN